MDYEEKFKYLTIYLRGINDSLNETEMEIKAHDLMKIIMDQVYKLEGE